MTWIAKRFQRYGATQASEHDDRIRLAGADDEGHAGCLAAASQHFLNAVIFRLRLVMKFAGRAVRIDAVDPGIDQDVDFPGERRKVDAVVIGDRKQQGRPVSGDGMAAGLQRHGSVSGVS